MSREDVGAVGRAIEDAGTLVLLILLAAIMWWFGGLLANGIDNFFSLSLSYTHAKATLPGIELAVIPLTAITAARLRFGVDRILALRASRVRIWLPLLMAALLFGLAAYLVWTWISPKAVFGWQLDFGPLRWLGIVLAAGFTWVWRPLFPRVTATPYGDHRCSPGAWTGSSRCAHQDLAPAADDRRTGAVRNRWLFVLSRVHARTLAHGRRTFRRWRHPRFKSARNGRLGRGCTLAVGRGAHRRRAACFL